MSAAPSAHRLTFWHWAVPAFLLAAGTVAVWMGDLDRRVAARFYDPGDPTGWPLGYEQPWHFLYRWAVLPAIVLAVVGLGIYAWSCLRPASRSVRRAGLLILLSLALGPGLMVNGILHETWGRPRPRQVTEFGGTKTFLPVLVPIYDPTSQSFPTGHAAGGFALMTLYFVLRERRPVLAWGALVTGLGLGGITAVARIAQGGHWLSDGLWSGGVVYLAAWAMAKALEPDLADPARPLRARPGVAVLCVVAAVALCGGYLGFNLPLLQRLDRDLDIPIGVKDVVLEVNGPPLEVHTRVGSGPGTRVTVTWSGRSALVAQLAGVWEPAQSSPTTLTGRYTVQVRGYQKRQNLEVWIAAPPTVRLTVRHVSGGS